MTNGTRIIEQLYRTGRILLCLAAVCTVLVTLPPRLSLASHEDETLFEGDDGALDNDSHVEGILRVFSQDWVVSLMMMTEQLTALMIQQMLIVGTFLDAQQQIDVQRLFQELSAQAYKDYHPSTQMCVFTTTVKSLAASDILVDENAQILDAVLEKREHQHAGLSTAGGTAIDVASRIRVFKGVYCDPNENNRSVNLLCGSTGGDTDSRTKDIDWPRLVDNRYTLNANFTDTENTTDENDILALAHNLYGGRIIGFMPEQMMNETAGQGIFLATRSVHAIRSVARRSFTKIVGMKAKGAPNAPWQVRPFLYGIISELGVPDDEIEAFLGDNPSYFAQMEVLTRKIYQSPEFFTNLYDKPENVRRIGVALQAIGIMQDRDRFESALRREMLISLILELKIRQYQENLERDLFVSINDKPDPAVWP